jgi:arylsulfatase A-like enzyme
MGDASILRLTARGLPACAAVGLLVGGLEALPLALAVKLAFPLWWYAALVLAAGAVYAALGLAVGAALGPLVHLAMRRIVVERGLGAQLALTAGALLLLLFSGFAEDAVASGRGPVAALLLALPLVLVATTFLLASRLYRPSERPAWPSAVVAGISAGGFVLLLLGGLGLRGSALGASGALPTDPRVLVVLVDSLRADLGSASTPAWDRLAASGATFTRAVTPHADTASAFATLQTGLSPLRHEVLGEGDRLRRVEALLSATFQAEGYATGGFVSSGSLGRAGGFDYGFDVYDDERAALPAALARVRPFGLALRVAGLVPERRADARTVDRFLGWLDGVADRPFFAIVHLHGPRAPYEPHGLPGFEANGSPGAPAFDHAATLGATGLDETDQRALRRLYREEVTAVDAQLGRMLDAVEGWGIADRTLVVVVGTGGEVLGEHGGAFTDRGLFDATVRVPLVIAPPGLAAPARVDADVRLYDLYATLLDHAELRPRHESESIALQGYIDGRRDRSLPTAVLGRDLDGAWAIGARNNGVKYWVRLADGAEHLFDLDEDPRESTDLRERMPDTLDQARRLVHPDRVRLTSLLRERPGLTVE